MRPQIYVFLGAATALALAGCMDNSEGTDGNGTNDAHTGKTGMALQAAVDSTGGTDVALMEYGITRIACQAGDKFDPLSRQVRVSLTDMLLPGGVPQWENSPLDKNSAHPFADDFEVVPAGCYDITAAPLAADASASQDCAAAFSNGVQVQDGLTTDVFMISQCRGVPTGAVDSTVALNRPPQLLQLTFSPSKYIQAGQKTTVCATATDPNGDPIQFAWSEINGAQCGEKVISDAKKDNDSTECVDIAPMEAGSYLFEVGIYDLLHDENGKLIRFEDWLKAHGYPNTSHASLRFPVYVGAAASK
jgi:hypothetical protein